MAAIASMTEDQIALVLGSVRERGAYKRFMAEFLASEAPGTNASEHFNGKKAGTLYQGFNSVRKDQNLENRVRVINHEENVYLIKVGEGETVSDDE